MIIQMVLIMKNNREIKLYICLNIILLIYSLSTVFSKIAAEQNFLSSAFCFCYMIVLLLLVIYAFCWQQIIKRMPLTTAYANKAITVVWGVIWGYIFFKEKITICKTVGMFLIILGIVTYAKSDNTK